MVQRFETVDVGTRSLSGPFEPWVADIGGIAVGEWLSPTFAPVLIAIIVLAAAGTTTLFFVGLVGYFRRRTARYRILTIVLGILVARSLVGMGTVLGLVPMVAHHLIEHGFDFLIAWLLLYLIYTEYGGRTSSEERVL